MELLDVIVLVMLKTMSYGIFVCHDSFIAKTIKGILINLLPTNSSSHSAVSPSETKPNPSTPHNVLLHPYISERMMKTMSLYCKKVVREYQQAMQRMNQQSAEPSHLPSEQFVAEAKSSLNVNPMNNIQSRVRSDSQSSIESNASSQYGVANKRHYVSSQSHHEYDQFHSMSSTASSLVHDEVQSEKLILALREGIVTLLEVISTILR